MNDSISDALVLFVVKANSLGAKIAQYWLFGMCPAIHKPTLTHRLTRLIASTILVTFMTCKDDKLVSPNS